MLGFNIIFQLVLVLDWNFQSWKVTFFCNSKDGEAFSYAEVWKVVKERSCTITENGKIRKPTFFLVFSSLLKIFFNYSAISCFGLPDGKCGKSLCLKPLIVQSRPLTGSVTLIFAFLCVRHLESLQWCCLLWILYCSAWRTGTHRQQSSKHHLREIIMMMVNLWSQLEQNINWIRTWGYLAIQRLIIPMFV